MHIVGSIVRFLVTAVVLMFVSWIIAGFNVGGFWSALMLALVIAAIAFIVETIIGNRISPFGRGIVGFLTSAVIIYVSQFFVPGVRITIIGALLAALVIGIIDLFIPVKTPFEYGNKWSDKGDNRT